MTDPLFVQFFIQLYCHTDLLFTFSCAIEKCVRIFVDKIDIKLKILWLSTFIDKLNLSIDNYRQISSIIDLSTTFSMIDFDRHVTSCITDYGQSPHQAAPSELSSKLLSI